MSVRINAILCILAPDVLIGLPQQTTTRQQPILPGHNVMLVVAILVLVALFLLCAAAAIREAEHEYRPHP